MRVLNREGLNGSGPVHNSDRVGPHVADQNVPGGIHREPPWGPILCRDGRTTIARAARRSGAGNPLHQTRGCDTADHVRGGVGDQKTAVQIDGQRPGIDEQRLRCGAAIAANAIVVGPSYGPNHSVGGHFADAVVGRIGDVDIPKRIDGDPVRERHSGGGGWTAVSAEACNTVAGDCLNGAAGADFSNATVPTVGDVEVASGVESQAGWCGQACVAGGAAIAAEPRVAGACDQGDGAVGRDAANGMIPLVGEIEIARRVARHPGRAHDGGPGQGNAVAETGASRDQPHGAGAVDCIQAPVRGDEHMAVRIDRYAARVGNGRDGIDCAIGCEALEGSIMQKEVEVPVRVQGNRPAALRNLGDGAMRIDFADEVIGIVGNEQVSEGVGR